MKKRKTPEAPGQQDSLFLWVDPTTIDASCWEYSLLARRDGWQPTAGMCLALRDQRVIIWTVEMDAGQRVKLPEAATVGRREIRELGRRGEIHIRLVDQHTLALATRNQLAKRGSISTIRDGDGLAGGQVVEDAASMLRLLVERPM